MTVAPIIGAGQPEIIVPADILETAAESMGAFFEPISKIDRHASARDFLDLSKSYKRAGIIERYTPLRSGKTAGGFLIGKH